MPGDGILLSEREAEGYKKKVGDPITVVFPAIGPQALTVAGIYETRRFSGAFPIDFIVSKRLFDQVFSGTQQDTLLYVKAEPGQAEAVGKRLSRSLADPFPNIDVQDRAQYLASREQTVDQFLNVFIALLLLSEIIAVLGHREHARCCRSTSGPERSGCSGRSARRDARSGRWSAASP